VNRKSPARSLVLMLALAATLLAQLPPGVTRFTSVEGITEYRLANGLRVLLFPDPTKQTITVNVTYLVGSRHENYGETGMAHLLEHLLFKGSARHKDIPKELSDHGTRPNGTTWLDRTNYYETFQATDANLEWALDLESDRMVNSFVAKKDLDSEMTVVRNEFEAGENDPHGVLFERVMSTAYLWHNYGKSTIGARSDIEKVNIERLQAFYRNYYQPDNAVLLVAGKIDEPKTLALVHKYFSPIPRPTRVIQPTYTDEPAQDGERFVTLRRVGDVQALLAAYHVPPGAHDDFPAAFLAGQALTTVPAGRLYKALVETKKAATVGGFTFALKEPGLMVFDAEVRKESSIDEARNAMLATLDGLQASPFTSEEVERVRTQSLKNIELTVNSSERFGLTLSEWIAQGDWRLFFLQRDRLRKVTTEQVQAAAMKYLKANNRTVGVYIPTAQPERVDIPAAPDVSALVKDYKGDVQISQGEAFDPSPSNIDARTRRGEVAGIKIAYLSKETRGDTVNATLRLHLGDEKSLMNKSVTARLTASMLMRGTTKRTRQQITDDLDKLKARVGVGGGPNSVTVTIESTRQNLPAVLEIVGEVLRSPSFPQNELDQLKQQQLAGIESMKSEPQGIVPRAFMRHLSPYPKGDVRYTPTFDEEIADIQAVTVDEMRKFHTGFYGVAKAEMVIIGDFDPEQAQTLTNKLFGGWKSAQAYVRVRSPYRKIAPVNESFQTPDKANAFFMAGQTIQIRDDHPDYAAMVLANYIIGGSGLNSRLFGRIRGKEGLSYGVGSQFQVQPEEDNAVFLAYAISAPENTLKVEASLKDELAKILKEGFTAEEVTAAKKSWEQQQNVSRAQDRELATRLAGWTYYGRTMAWDADLERKVQSLTPAQLVEALRRHLDLNAITIMKGGDFKKAGVAP